MSPIFKVLGVLLVAYAAYAIFRGEVYAKRGPGGATVERAASPRYFWAVIAIYLALAAALMTVF